MIMNKNRAVLLDLAYCTSVIVLMVFVASLDVFLVNIVNGGIGFAVMLWLLYLIHKLK